MASMAREAWTDERLDDLNIRVDGGFEEMRQEFRAVRGEIQGVRGEMGEIRAELSALNRTIHQFLFAIVGTIFLGFMGTISALVTLT
jgi:hypothetical protein